MVYVCVFMVCLWCVYMCGVIFINLYLLTVNCIGIVYIFCFVGVFNILFKQKYFF